MGIEQRLLELTEEVKRDWAEGKRKDQWDDWEGVGKWIIKKKGGDRHFVDCALQKKGRRRCSDMSGRTSTMGTPERGKMVRIKGRTSVKEVVTFRKEEGGCGGVSPNGEQTARRGLFINRNQR